MAPSSILAEQHYGTLSGLLAGEGGVLAQDQIRLLLGDTPEAVRCLPVPGAMAGCSGGAHNGEG